MVQNLTGIVEDGTGGLANNLLQGLPLQTASGEQLVQIVYIGLQMLSMMGGDNGLGQVMEYIQKNGGDAKSAFYNLANQLGADPQEVLSQAKEMMNK